MSFETSRSMGRAAVLVLLIGVVVSPILVFAGIYSRTSFPVAIVVSIVSGGIGFIGNILFLVAMNGFAKFYQTPSIFRNALCAFLSAAIGGVTLSLVLFGWVASMIPPSYTPPGYAYGPPLSSSVLSFFAALAIVWIGLFLIVLIQSIFFRASLNALAAKSGEENFKTAGLLMLIGGALTIVFIGFFVFFVGWVFTAMGFFSIKPPPTQKPATIQPSAAAKSMPQRICSNCGASNNETALYCSHCGNKL